MSASLAVAVTGLSKGFGAHQILTDLSLTVAPGTVFGLVGLNGAGKTTLIRLLLGLLRPDCGVVSVLGHDPWKHAASLYRRLGVVLEHEGFWGNLTVAQNLALFGQAKGLSAGDVSAYLQECWAGSEIVTSRKKVRFFSRGQKVQCGLCRAFMGKPELLLLDEPTVALDPKAYEHFCGLVKRARAQGAAVLISSHQLSAVEELCDSVGVLQNGSLTMLDTSAPDQGQQAWVLAADQNPQWPPIIAKVTGAAPRYEAGYWHFTVTKPDEQIPGIVWRLVESGCSIKEVRPSERGLRQALRQMFN